MQISFILAFSKEYEALFSKGRQRTSAWWLLCSQLKTAH